MKVNDKPTGMNNPDAVGMQTTRDQSPHVRPFLSWRFGHENIYTWKKVREHPD